MKLIELEEVYLPVLRRIVLELDFVKVGLVLWIKE